MKQLSLDEQWMDRALALARKGIGLASPNPTVGCVLVDESQTVVGEGFHSYETRDHAEVVALRQASARSRNGARGSTAYVTLEPCSHFGRTGPCADALIAAGVARVVISTLDVNPVVRGHGAERLRQAGVTVEIGPGRKEAQGLNNAFAKYIRTGLPWVTLKSALSLDGRIAPPAHLRPPGQPFWLTGEEARAEVQQMRHAHDAVLTGINTALADNPQLTDRSGLPRRLPIQRVVLDSQLRLPPAARMLNPREGEVLVFTASRDEDRAEALRDKGVCVEHVESDDAGLSFSLVLARLGERGITSVMIESGTGLNTVVIAEDMVDRLVLFYAPVLLGLEGLPFVDQAARLRSALDIETSWFGSDLCVNRTLKTYWD